MDLTKMTPQEIEALLRPSAEYAEDAPAYLWNFNA
jgi:hypothetical protein